MSPTPLDPDLGGILQGMSDRITRLENAFNNGAGDRELFATLDSFTITAGAGTWQSVGLGLIVPYTGRYRVCTGARFNLVDTSWVYVAPTLNAAASVSDGVAMYGSTSGNGGSCFREQEADLPEGYNVTLWANRTVANAASLGQITLSLCYLGQ